MKELSYSEIEVMDDIKVCRYNTDNNGGKPIIRGLRITVEQILKALTGGAPRHELLEDYPELDRKTFRSSCFMPLNGLEKKAYFGLMQEIGYNNASFRVKLLKL